MELHKNAKRYSKKQAYDTLLAIKLHGGALSDQEIDSLLLHFAPARTAGSPKDAFAWVALAAGIADKRKQLRYVHVFGGEGYASDGYRLHRAPLALEDGCYCPTTRARVPSQPVWEDGFTRVSQVAPPEAEAELSEMTPGMTASGKVTFLRLPGGGAAVQQKYLLHATGGQGRVKFGVDAFFGESAFGRWKIMRFLL